MKLIPGGEWPVGCHTGDSHCWEDEGPARRVTLKAFALLEREVSVAEYKACVLAGKCGALVKGCRRHKKGRQSDPITCVSWAEAVAFCGWRGWRLPSEAEWEVAARGPKHFDFPWGNTPPVCAKAPGKVRVGCRKRPAPVGTRSADRSPFGILDMAGNVREWTQTSYAAYPGGKATAGSVGKVVKGGSYIMGKRDGVSTTHLRGVVEPTLGHADLGFRCAAAPRLEAAQ